MWDQRSGKQRQSLDDRRHTFHAQRTRFQIVDLLYRQGSTLLQLLRRGEHEAGRWGHGCYSFAHHTSCLQLGDGKLGGVMLINPTRDCDSADKKNASTQASNDLSCPHTFLQIKKVMRLYLITLMLFNSIGFMRVVPQFELIAPV